MAANDLEKNIKHNNQRLLTLVVIFLAAQLAWAVYRDSQLIVVKSVDMDNLQMVSESALCPGDKLIFRYDLHIRGKGRLVRDVTLWKVDPPRTLIYSTERRFTVDVPVEQRLQEAWNLPPNYYNYETAEMETLPPGEYRRYITISPLYEENAFDLEFVPFTVKEPSECQPR